MQIKNNDIIDSIAYALQYISYYHTPDFITAMHQAYKQETNESAKNAIAQILINSKMAAIGQRPICQDTGMVNVFVDIGVEVVWQKNTDLTALINEGVAKAYTDPSNVLRASVVCQPIFRRENTGNNTPAVIHMRLVKGNKLDFFIGAKGAGSENKAKFAVLNPNDSVIDWVLKTVPTMGAGWCPPGMLGIGIGGSSEQAMLMAKRCLFETIDMPELIANGAQDELQTLRLSLYEKINQLGIGAQGLGGLTTVLDVKIKTHPTHAASLPIAIIPNCAATRHVHFQLDGSGVAKLPAVDIDNYPDIAIDYSQYKRVNLDNLSANDIATWQIGETLLLSGTLLTARDAAHKKLLAGIESGQGLPKGVDFNNRFIYYVGPVDAIKDEVIGPAGPTTATRMDKFSTQILANLPILGMIGKAEHGKNTVALLKKHRRVYLIAVGGAAYLISKSIKKSKIVAFPELGMEAIYQLTVKDMPVTVAVDTMGKNIHQVFQQFDIK